MKTKILNRMKNGVDIPSPRPHPAPLSFLEIINSYLYHSSICMDRCFLEYYSYSTIYRTWCPLNWFTTLTTINDYQIILLITLPFYVILFLIFYYSTYAHSWHYVRACVLRTKPRHVFTVAWFMIACMRKFN